MNSLRDRIKELERAEIINALSDCGWVMARAAKKLGITERMIGYKIRKYGIRKKEEEFIDDQHWLNGCDGEALTLRNVHKNNGVRKKGG